MALKVLTANIKDNPDMPDAHVRSDLQKIRRWRPGVQFAGFQEIGDPADHRNVSNAFSRLRGFRQLFWHRQTPIVVRYLMWSVLDRYWVKAHSGMHGVSPSRGFSVTLNQHRLQRWKFAFIDSHFVSGAWYGSHTNQAWRREKWVEHFNELQDHIEQLNADGYTVVVLADWNRHQEDIPRLTPTSFLAATNHYYDHIYVCPSSGGVKLQVAAEAVMTSHLYTDHNPVFAALKVV